MDASGRAVAWGWAAAGQLGRWDESKQRLSASIDSLGIRTDNGLCGVLLSDQEGHRALHGKESKLSWAAVALQPRHQDLSSAVEAAGRSDPDVNRMPGCRAEDTGTLKESQDQSPGLQGFDADHGHKPGAVGMRGAGSETPGTQRSWHDPVHGLCIAIPTQLVLTSSEGVCDWVMSCHAEWWHTLLLLSPSRPPNRCQHRG